MLRNDAERMEFDVLITFKGHHESNAHAVVLNDSRVQNLKLFVKLLSLLDFVPKSTSSCNGSAHGAQKHVGEKRKIIVGCLTGGHHDLS